MSFADLPEEDQIARVTKALLAAVGPNPSPRDFWALSAAALELARALQLALGDHALPDDRVSESKVVHAA
jgi:hypothetical protein